MMCLLLCQKSLFQPFPVSKENNTVTDANPAELDSLQYGTFRDHFLAKKQENNL